MISKGGKILIEFEGAVIYNPIQPLHLLQVIVINCIAMGEKWFSV